MTLSRTYYIYWQKKKKLHNAATIPVYTVSFGNLDKNKPLRLSVVVNKHKLTKHTTEWATYFPFLKRNKNNGTKL